ncbi:ribosome maturation factor RimP [Arenibacter certesii]|uniref:Ribosome maturation factor RimP n=2 Tax=Arenibacter certesii TaxID=228955 RepID=A0A918IVB0_9FLAO|nr:ribosome maturation factor RimP [Arenibacter certesii]
MADMPKIAWPRLIEAIAKREIMLKEKVTTLLESALEENESLFLLDFSIGTDNKIKITLDGDNGVTLQDCINVSRAIEHNLDREEEDFSLEVASAGAASPIKIPRQFKKNIGRKLEVKTQDEELEGKLTEATEDSITLEWKDREPKPVGKGKITIQKKRQIAISDIKEAKVVLKF